MILSEIRTTYYPEVEEDVFWGIVRLSLRVRQAPYTTRNPAICPRRRSTTYTRWRSQN